MGLQLFRTVSHAKPESKIEQIENLAKNVK